ncbi:MAG: IPT/TIG domain-containing protein [Acidobacteria bacterium]|nr:IPT/TIG domain-containing protein [Acidobacteriota bacterium]
MSAFVFRAGALSFALMATVSGQNLAPVIHPRGVVNAYSQQPAPSQVGAGSVVWINGLNLGPPAGATADSPNWPTELGGVQVLINNRPAPLGSVSPSRIVAQVPLETPNGLMNVEVRRGEARSRPARINVFAIFPVVRTNDDKGYGEVSGAASGSSYAFTASGLGVTDPRVNTGEAAPADAAARPRQAVNVYLGGAKLDADIKASSKRPGDFDVSVSVPEGTLPGDLLLVQAANRLSNYGVWRRMNRPEVTFVPMPDGAPVVRGMAASDLAGGFLIASAARTSEGCWPSVLFDLRAKRAANISQCLTVANQNAVTPVVAAVNSPALAALIGPPQGADVAQGVSSKVALFQPSRTEAMGVDLPGNAAALNGNAQGGFNAVMPGTPPQVANIDAATGDIQLAQGAGGGAGGGAGAQAAVLNPLTLQVNLGGGLDKVLTAVTNTGQGQFSVVIGNDLDNPTSAKLVILNPQGEVTASRDFPDGFLPMVMPNPPAQPAPGGGGGGQVGPGGGGPGGGGQGGGGGVVIVAPGGAVQVQVRFRVATFFDAQTRNFYVAARKADDSAHSLVVFAPNDVKAIALPAGRFIAACTPNAQIANIETSRRIVLMGSNSADRQFRQVCGALSFLVLDLGSQEFTDVALPGQGQINVTNNVPDLNDFLLAASTEGDTMFAMDGVTLSAYRLNLPQGVIGFQNLQPVPDMELAVAVGRVRQQNGDGGFLIFDLENLEVRQLLLPDGFATAQLVGILPATRKLVARGNRQGGSQFLVYDLISGDLEIIANPPGVAYVGNAPVPAGQPAQQQAPAMMRVNAKANTIEAITINDARATTGAMLVRIP